VHRSKKRSLKSESGQFWVIAAMSAARPLFHRKRKSVHNLAMSQKCQFRP